MFHCFASIWSLQWVFSNFHCLLTLPVNHLSLPVFHRSVSILRKLKVNFLNTLSNVELLSIKYFKLPFGWMVIKKPWYRLHSLFRNQKCTKISFEFEKMLFFIFGGSICSVKFSWTGGPEMDAAIKRIPNCCWKSFTPSNQAIAKPIWLFSKNTCVRTLTRIYKQPICIRINVQQVYNNFNIICFWKWVSAYGVNRINRKRLWARKGSCRKYAHFWFWHIFTWTESPYCRFCCSVAQQ